MFSLDGEVFSYVFSVFGETKTSGAAGLDRYLGFGLCAGPIQHGQSSSPAQPILQMITATVLLKIEDTTDTGIEENSVRNSKRETSFERNSFGG